jgi:uncharacterized protein (TIGR02001 family)
VRKRSETLNIAVLAFLLLALPAHAAATQDDDDDSDEVGPPASASASAKGDDEDDDDETPDAKTVTGNITLASDYLIQGISQTGHEPAIQGGFDWVHPAGPTLGLWGSNVSSPSRDPRDLEADEAGNVPPFSALELDFYGGYKLRISEDWKASLTLLYFTYWGLGGGHNGIEIPLKFGWRSFYLELSATLPRDGASSEYLNGGWAGKVPWKTSVDAGAGMTWLSNGVHYADLHVSVAHDFLDLEWKLLLSALTDNELIAVEGNPRLVFSVSKEF